MYSSVLHTKGYLGLSARNSDGSLKDIDLNVMKVTNQNPNAYRDDGEEMLYEDPVVDSIERREEKREKRERRQQEQQ